MSGAHPQPVPTVVDFEVEPSVPSPRTVRQLKLRTQKPNRVVCAIKHVACTVMCGEPNQTCTFGRTQQLKAEEPPFSFSVRSNRETGERRHLRKGCPQRDLFAFCHNHLVKSNKPFTMQAFRPAPSPYTVHTHREPPVRHHAQPRGQGSNSACVPSRELRAGGVHAVAGGKARP